MPKAYKHSTWEAEAGPGVQGWPEQQSEAPGKGEKKKKRVRERKEGEKNKRGEGKRDELLALKCDS